MNHLAKYIILVLLATTVKLSAQEVRAFPSAEGFGAFTTGGRGGTVVYVTNLNDEGEGSLRSAIQKKYPRMVVFKVSGTIYLKRNLDIRHDSITIAGQTAPGDGICIAGCPLVVEANNVIIRYLRCRLGDINKVEEDAFTSTSHNKGLVTFKNIIIDHCSFSWSTDECASLYGNNNVTFQWCMVSESLRNSVHHKGTHGYGGIWGGNGISFHHNLLAHNDSRNPRFCHPGITNNAGVIDYRNNVVYNWGLNSSYGGETRTVNLVNNYYKPGPATLKHRDRIFAPSKPYGKYYVDGNYMWGDEKCSKDNWSYGIQGEEMNDSTKKSIRLYEPLPIASVATQSAEKAYQLVLDRCGASLHRDAVDARVIKEVRTGTAPFGKMHNGLIDSQEEVGGYPELKSAQPLLDTDNDGMPDEWEKAHQLNPKDKKDSSRYTLSKKYTNIEVYLNSLVGESEKD
jgi:pectate lyase